MQRPGVMGEGSGVDEDALGPRALRLEEVDEQALVVTLVDADGHSELRRPAGNNGVELGQRGVPVEVGLALSEEI